MGQAMCFGRFLLSVMLTWSAASCRTATPPPDAPMVTLPASNEANAAGAEQRPPPAATRLESFQATLRIDAEPGPKGFQGVWLERSKGERLLIAYRPHGHWQPFAGHQVKVVGERYVPDGQAVVAEHFRVHSLTIDPKKMTSLVRVEAERVLEGQLEERTMEAGTKLAGESFTYFLAADGTSYLPANRLDTMPLVGKIVRIKARPVEPTPYVTRLGGPYLWLIEVMP